MAELLKGVVAVKKFFESGDGRAVPMTEMQQFWKALSPEEKTEFSLYAESKVNAQVAAA